jgi:hypothetical protein
MRFKRTENCPRRATFSLRVFLPHRLLGRVSHQAAHILQKTTEKNRHFVDPFSVTRSFEVANSAANRSHYQGAALLRWYQKSAGRRNRDREREHSSPHVAWTRFCNIREKLPRN